MKRDIDLARQLLLNLESHGPECSANLLCPGTTLDADERVRYHLRLLVDAGLAQEIERGSGNACLRLTNSGHEFLELARHEGRWRDAKWVVQEQSAGSSLTVLRAVLTSWALQAANRRERIRRYRRVYRPHYYRPEPGYRVDSYRYEREPYYGEEELQRLRARPEYREGWEAESDGYAYEAEPEAPLGITLPVEPL